jgi:hypothetical protein
MVGRFRDMLKSFSLSPYSRNEWSKYDSNPVNQAASYGSQFAQNLGALGTTHLSTIFSSQSHLRLGWIVGDTYCFVGVTVDDYEAHCKATSYWEI